MKVRALKLIVNADDFGYSRAVSYGIVDAHHTGIVTSTTMMCNIGDLEHPVQLAQENQTLGIGIHLVLTSGSPVSENVPSLVDWNGRFYSYREFLNNIQSIKKEEIEREWTSQIERFLSTGLKPTHLDTHHHVHAQQEVLPIAIQLAKKYGLPLRRVNNESTLESVYGSVKTTNLLFTDFYKENVNIECFEALLLNSVGKVQTVEINCHPGYVDGKLVKQSSYVYQRIKEFTVLTSREIKSRIKQLNIDLITFSDI